MTPKERRNPSVLNASRRKRIAAGSGTIAVDNSRTVQQLQKTGFTEPVAAPEQLLRAFRFSAEERIGTGE